jgi:hypothetical protein
MPCGLSFQHPHPAASAPLRAELVLAGTSSLRRYPPAPERSIITNKFLGLVLASLSFGLGLTELGRSRQITGALGVQGREDVGRAYGYRELASGAALLLAPTSAAPVWVRVAGDVLDLGTLGAASLERCAKTGPILGALTFVSSALLRDVWAARRMQRA